MKTNGLIIAASNPAKELEDYRDRVDRFFGDTLLPKPCSACGAETLPEHLNSADQCAKCGPADPKVAPAEPMRPRRSKYVPRHERPVLQPSVKKAVR